MLLEVFVSGVCGGLLLATGDSWVVDPWTESGDSKNAQIEWSGGKGKFKNSEQSFGRNS